MLHHRPAAFEAAFVTKERCMATSALDVLLTLRLLADRCSLGIFAAGFWVPILARCWLAPCCKVFIVSHFVQNHGIMHN